MIVVFFLLSWSLVDTFNWLLYRSSALMDSGRKRADSARGFLAAAVGAGDIVSRE